MPFDWALQLVNILAHKPKSEMRKTQVKGMEISAAVTKESEKGALVTGSLGRLTVHRRLIPQRGEKHHQDDDELENLNLVKQPNAVTVLEVLDALLKVVCYLRQLLYGTDALHEYSILRKKSP